MLWKLSDSDNCNSPSTRHAKFTLTIRPCSIFLSFASPLHWRNFRFSSEKILQKEINEWRWIRKRPLICFKITSNWAKSDFTAITFGFFDNLRSNYEFRNKMIDLRDWSNLKFLINPKLNSFDRKFPIYWRNP